MLGVSGNIIILSVYNRHLRRQLIRLKKRSTGIKEVEAILTDNLNEQMI